MSIEIYYDNYLSHHGIKGQKWGVRRFQNVDGSYKKGSEGRYDESDGPSKRKGLSDKQKKVLKIAAGVTVAAAATVGAVFVAKKLNMKITSGLVKEHVTLGKNYVSKANTAYEKANISRRVFGDSILESKWNSIGDNYLAEARWHRSLSENPDMFDLKDKYKYAKRAVKGTAKAVNKFLRK